MGHQKDLLSGFSRCFERIFLLLFSFDNPFSHFVGVNGVVESGWGRHPGDGVQAFMVARPAMPFLVPLRIRPHLKTYL